MLLLLWQRKYFADFSEWASWERWGSCSVSCGEGTKSRSRVCKDGKACNGDSTEKKKCKEKDCAGNIFSVMISSYLTYSVCDCTSVCLIVETEFQKTVK